jgi:hypothetical protein
MSHARPLRRVFEKLCRGSTPFARGFVRQRATHTQRPPRTRSACRRRGSAPRAVGAGRTPACRTWPAARRARGSGDRVAGGQRDGRACFCASVARPKSLRSRRRASVQAAPVCRIGRVRAAGPPAYARRDGQTCLARPVLPLAVSAIRVSVPAVPAAHRFPARGLSRDAHAVRAAGSPAHPTRRTGALGAPHVRGSRRIH